MRKTRIIGLTFTTFMIASMLGGFVMAAQGASELSSDDILNYPTVSLFIEGNYTVSSTSIASKGYQKLDNFLGMSETGDPVFSFNIGINSVTDDTDELGIAEDWDMYSIDNDNYYLSDLFVDDQSNLVENSTTIESGQTFFYGTEWTASSYPFLWVSGIHSPVVGTNTTIIIADGASTVTVLNSWITQKSEYWFDLTASASALTSPDNVTIANGAISGSVRIFNIGGSRELKDGRHITNYVGGTSYAGSATTSTVLGAGDLDDIIAKGITPLVSIPTQLKPIATQRVQHRITGWGSRQQLEAQLEEAIALMHKILADDIQSYKITTAQIINAIPPKVHEVCKSFAVEVAGRTSTLNDFTEGLEDTSITGSVIIADNPADKPLAFIGNAWSWIKENAEKIIDNTKSAIASIVHGKSSGEWGATMTDEITDSNGQIDESPTVLNTLSDKVFQAINFMQRNWYWFAAGGLLIGTIITIIILKRI